MVNYLHDENKEFLDRLQEYKYGRVISMRDEYPGEIDGELDSWDYWEDKEDINNFLSK